MTELNPAGWPRISLRPLFRLGVVGNPLHIENRRTMIANQLAVFFVLLSVPTVLLEVLQYPEFAVAQVVFLGFWSLMGSVLLLNRSGRLRTARFVFIGTILFYFYIINLMWPPINLEFKAAPCFFQLGVLACALVLFDARRDRWLVLGIILTVFLQVTFFYELDKKIDFFNLPYSHEDLQVRAAMMNAITIFSIVFAILFYQRISKQAEARAEQLLDDLQTQNNDLQTLQGQVEHSNRQLAQSLASVETSRNELADAHEELHRLGELKDALTGMVVHDLKNPLQAVLGLATLPPDAARLQVIRHAGQQMATLVSNLLDVQKYETHALNLQSEPVPALEILQAATLQTEYLAQQKHIGFDVQATADLVVEGDRDLLERVCINLLTNAIKYAPNGDTLVLEAIHDGEQGALFRITDHGRGIAPDQLEQVFDKYAQVDGGRSMGKLRSTGLGLTFCKLTVEAHGGTIRALSTVGQFTTIEFKLPKARLLNHATSNGRPPDRVASSDLTPELLHRYAPTLAALAACEPHEISHIFDLLDGIDDSTPAVLAWRAAVERAALAGDTGRYRQLLA